MLAAWPPLYWAEGKEETENLVQRSPLLAVPPADVQLLRKTHPSRGSSSLEETLQESNQEFPQDQQGSLRPWGQNGHRGQVSADLLTTPHIPETCDN